MTPIVLSVKRGLWRDDDANAEAADKDFGAVRARVLERDKFTCRFCDYTSAKYQDVHHVNDDHQDSRLENLVTACKLCHACHHIGLAGQNQGAMMIYLPEVPQHVLNRFLRAMFVMSRIGSPDQKKHAEAAWDQLCGRKQAVIDQWGTADPVMFANALMKQPQEDYEQRSTVLLPLRLVVSTRSKMFGRDVLDHWARNDFARIPANVWDIIQRNVYAPT